MRVAAVARRTGGAVAVIVAAVVGAARRCPLGAGPALSPAARAVPRDGEDRARDQQGGEGVKHHSLAG